MLTLDLVIENNQASDGRQAEEFLFVWYFTLINFKKIFFPLIKFNYSFTLNCYIFRTTDSVHGFHDDLKSCAQIHENKSVTERTWNLLSLFFLLGAC